MWTTEKEIKQQLDKLWQKGGFLSAVVSGESLFPLKLKLNKPTSKQITEQFEQVRKWVAELAKLSFIQIEWKSISHRIQGEQQIPESIWIKDLDTLLTVLRQKSVYQQFISLVEMTKGEPQLLVWLEKYPFKAVELAEQWQSLLKVVEWRKQNPSPNIYLRQVDIPTIHTKFIEQHKAVLAELFNLVLDESQIDSQFSGVSQFAQRYGFCDKLKPVRLRNLDPDYPILSEISYSDISLDPSSFAQLQPKVSKVIIVENEINYLTLPNIKDCWAIWGAGYGVNQLINAKWLNKCQLYYWGDIDTHGFAILNQLRTAFPKVTSLLMDKEVLVDNLALCSREEKQSNAVLSNLTEQEQVLYQALQQNYYGEKLRLEQEFVPFGVAIRRLECLGT
ncbi:hypothetical protein BMT54_12030 [Pasteurellaceae bacterium 15-036681]|nr:hypothetical protein BMT54_12030 [Pasteurellaceae bacterium 15-036681]